MHWTRIESDRIRFSFQFRSTPGLVFESLSHHKTLLPKNVRTNAPWQKLGYNLEISHKRNALKFQLLNKFSGLRREWKKLMRQVAALPKCIQIYAEPVSMQMLNTRDRLWDRFEIAPSQARNAVLPKLHFKLPKVRPGPDASHLFTVQSSPVRTVQFTASGRWRCWFLNYGRGGAGWAAVSSSLSSRLPHRKPFGNNWRRGKTINYITKICSDCDCARVKEERKSKTGFIIFTAKHARKRAKVIAKKLWGKPCTETKL